LRRKESGITYFYAFEPSVQGYKAYKKQKTEYLIQRFGSIIQEKLVKPEFIPRNKRPEFAGADWRKECRGFDTRPKKKV